MTASPPRSDIPTQYEFATSDPELYDRWEKAGVFGADATCSNRNGGDKAPFVIVMPPPNVTAQLHMGHGLDNTIQDVLIRWRRMAGDEALWVPGSDHAGIATQNVVEKQLAREGRTRFDLGRQAFVNRTEHFVHETGGVIFQQLRAIGASCDWSRAAYTLSPELSRAVREAFVRLYEKELIYRGHRVIHWCPRCLTSLSDEEAEFKDTPGTLYHIRYPVAGDDSRSVTVATTRPETMLGDVAVAVHPDDERYRDLVGHTVILPIVNREIPVIADEYTDPAFGTGVVKITPAHDANDFDVGRRHDLPMPVVIDPGALLREVSDAAGRVPPDLQGLDRAEGRKRIVALLREQGQLVKEQPHDHAVRHCYRCDTVVEPRLSDQWFVRMAPLAAPALAALDSGEIRIVPEKYEGVYRHWLANIRDWNISRQLWWGHRIPVWYCDDCEWHGALREDPTNCPSCAGRRLRQDEDVLDTWFSSWLWPFSTLGWPEPTTDDLRAFYPTDVLVSGPDILFFWVSRMIMAGYEFMERAPFHTVYLHGIARDPQHRKMSKSLGNGIDPLDVVQRFGADALRYTVVAGMGLGVDIVWDPSDLEKSFGPGRNFATKLWNIGRFLLMSVGGEPVRDLEDVPPHRLTRADHWILAQLDAAVRACDTALGPARPSAGDAWTGGERTAGLRLNDYADAARAFVWNDLADWYLESTKARLATEGDDREVARAVLVHAFDRALRLLHPIMPFVTEALWQRLPGRRDDELLAAADWPEPAGRAGAGAAAEFEHVRAAVIGIRQVRADYNVAPGTSVDVVIVAAHEGSASPFARFHAEAALIGRLSRSTVRVSQQAPEGAAAHVLLADGTNVVVPLAGLVDVGKECARLRAEVEQIGKQLIGLRARLGNPAFLERAKPEVVEGERAKERDYTARLELLQGKIATLCGE